MIKNKIISLLSITLACGLSTIQTNAQKAFSDSKPNVLFIVVDDMNTLAVKKNYPQIKTPALDKFMNESYYFPNGTCAAPVCNPSRTAFFSGRSPHITGSYFNNVNPWLKSDLLAKTEVIPETFKKNGYETWGGGKIFHVVPNDNREKKMFDNTIFKGNYGPFSDIAHRYGKGRWMSVQPWTGPDTDFTDVVNANAIEEFFNKDHNKPFFLYYGLYRPHSPYTAPERFFKMYNNVNFSPPPGYAKNDLDDVPAYGRALAARGNMNEFSKQGLTKHQVWMDLMRAYCANSSFADWNVGRVLEALDKSRYANNTIVIFIADNGFHTGTKDHWPKGTMWDASDVIPFLIRLPERKKMVCNQTVSTLDIYPTLIEYCGLTPPAHPLEGQSIMPILKSSAASWDRYGMTFYGEGVVGVRSERYRYIQYPDGTEELYDHSQDPYELKNIAAVPDMQKIKNDLKKGIPSSFAKSLGGDGAINTED